MQATQVAVQAIETEVVDSLQEQLAVNAVRELTALELAMIGGGSGNVIFM